MPFKNLIGLRFGSLVAIQRVAHGKEFPCGKSATTYVCRCDCGKTKEILSVSLTSQNTRSCGCLKSKMITLRKMKKPFEGTYNVLARVAKRSGRECLISYEDFLEFTKQDTCHYCDDKMNWHPHRSFRRAGGTGYYLDRKDNTKGYTKDNCVVACSRCNQSKSCTFSYEEWLQIGKLIKSWRDNGSK